MIEYLAAAGPDPALGDRLDDFGRFVGGWDMRIRHLPAGGEPVELTGEWHFGWVLGGRAVQDVLVTHQAGRHDGFVAVAGGAGTTVRFADARTGRWYACWLGPVNGNVCTLTGGAEGDRLVLHGTDQRSGELLRWSFSDISATSFSWTGEVSADDGRTWRVEQEMAATRRAQHSGSAGWP
ncbi:hypothetical protein [Qaidamihabitans albus]|uniref:hypothetical protein n=1 Tax=Qaidamihabitans albus TaxID=2795733 RepID=UPI0018F21A48|nr:hypothetical protein [Qaidamihabitans albus]